MYIFLKKRHAHGPQMYEKLGLSVVTKKMQIISSEDITSCLWGWLLLKRAKVIIADEDGEKRK